MFDLGRLFRYETFGVNQYVPRKKEWVPAVIGAAVSLGSTIFGASKSASAEKRAREKEAQAHASNSAYWQRRINEDYADTAAGQNMIRRAKEYANQNWKKAQGASAVGGGTDASVALEKEAGNKVVGDTFSNIAAQDTARKDRAGAALVSENNSYTSKQANALRTQGANTAQAASAMGNAVGGAISSIGGAYEAKANANKAADTTISNMNSTAKSTLGSNNVEFNQAEKASGLGGTSWEEEQKKRIASVKKDFGLA